MDTLRLTNVLAETERMGSIIFKYASAEQVRSFIVTLDRLLEEATSLLLVLAARKEKNE